MEEQVSKLVIKNLNMKKKYLLFSLICGLCLFSCSNEKKEAELQSRITDLEKQLDECKNGEEKLFTNIKSMYDKKNYKAASSYYTELLNKFPASSYLKEAKEIFYKSNIEIKKEHEATAKTKAAEEAKKTASLTKLNKKYDDVSGTTWYKQKYFTHYSNTNKVSLDLGHKKGMEPWLNLTMSYTGEDWIFFDHAYLSYDGNTREIVYDKYRDKETDNGSGGVWEWITVSVNEAQIEWLKEFAKSPNAKMRLTGKYEKTRNLSNQERQGISDIIAGYEYLKENKN